MVVTWPPKMVNTCKSVPFSRTGWVVMACSGSCRFSDTACHSHLHMHLLIHHLVCSQNHLRMHMSAFVWHRAGPCHTGWSGVWKPDTAPGPVVRRNVSPFHMKENLQTPSKWAEGRTASACRVAGMGLPMSAQVRSSVGHKLPQKSGVTYRGPQHWLSPKVDLLEKQLHWP